jgi:hypothetical protein
MTSTKFKLWFGENWDPIKELDMKFKKQKSSILKIKIPNNLNKDGKKTLLISLWTSINLDNYNFSITKCLFKALGVFKNTTLEFSNLN